MAHVNLPRELEEDILSRLQPLTLARFRSVCKRWNDLVHETMARALPHFIVLSHSKIYSVDIIGLDGIEPRMMLHTIPSSTSTIPYQDSECTYTKTAITTFDGFLLLTSWWLENGTALWNPWLRHVNKLFTHAKWIELEDKNIYVCGVGYDNNRPEKVYKVFGCCVQSLRNKVVIYECASQALKFIDTPDEEWDFREVRRYHVSLNGNLYWINLTSKIRGQYIQSFDFSRDILKPFCLLPCRKETQDTLVLAVYKGDKFSLLKQCDVTRNIEIWVTKKRIDSNNSIGEEDVWINLMTLPTTNLPTLADKLVDEVSYFIHDKTLIMCCAEDEHSGRHGLTSIYIVRRDMFKKLPIDSSLRRCCHCVYAPNFIPIPLEFRSQIE